MRAIMCRSFGPPSALSYETDAPDPPLGDSGVRVRVHAAGVNFPDTLIIQDKYQYKPPLPFSPGAEFAGEVIETGPQARRFQPGQRVIGVTMFGAFASQVVAEERQLTPMPDSVDFATAAAFSMTYGTSIHALDQRGRLRAGETLLVLGATGGVGMAAVELGKVMGARVIAAGGDDGKLAEARRAGADEVINYKTENLRDGVKRLCREGADVIYDAVGGDLGELALRCLAWRGRLLIVGFAAGRIPKLAANLLLLKGAAATGVFWGDFRAREPEADAANFARLFAWLQEGKLKPHIGATYPLARTAEALEALLNRRVVGKLVITMEE